MSIVNDGSGLQNWSDGFAMVPRETAQDSRLSARARGVLTLVLSLPNDWDLRMEWLVKQFPEGRDAVTGAVRELRRFGYYRVERRRRSDGTFTTGVSASNRARPDWAEQHAAACADQGTDKPKWDVSRRLLPNGRIEDQPRPAEAEVEPDLTLVTEGDEASANHRKRETSERSASDGKPRDGSSGDGSTPHQRKNTHKDTPQRQRENSSSSYVSRAAAPPSPATPPCSLCDESETAVVAIDGKDVTIKCFHHSHADNVCRARAKQHWRTNWRKQPEAGEAAG
jgi:hypothetical protein